MTDIDRATAREVLDLPMPADNDAEAATIRDYLVALLRQLWTEGEGFSSKRPFGNSGWEWDMYPPLIRAGLVSGELDEDGSISYRNWMYRIDEGHAASLITAAIDELGRA
jgi:hypothetical protein